MQFSEKERVILRKKFEMAHLQKKAWFVEDAPHVQEMRHLLDAGKNVYVWGKSGVGKTFAASVLLQTSIIRQMDEKFLHYRIVHMYDLEAEFRRSKRFDYEGDDPLHDAKFPTLLVLDDVGLEKPTEDMVNLLFQVLNYREEKNKQTVFLSNYSLQELSTRFNSSGVEDNTIAAVKSRLKKDCQIIHFTGADRRRE